MKTLKSARLQLFWVVLTLNNPTWADQNCALSTAFDQHLCLGQYFLEHHTPGRAVSEFESAVLMAPERAEAHYNLGLALRVWGDLQGAEAALRKALDLQPRFPEAHFVLGLALGDRIGSERLGLAEFEDAVLQNPIHSEAHFNIGIIYWKADDPKRAAQAFSKAVDTNPKSATFRLRFGQALAKLGRLSDAVRELKRAIELDPAHVPAHYQLGLVLMKRKENAKAAQQMDIVRRLQNEGDRAVEKDQSHLAYQEGMSALEQGQTDVSIQKLTRALQRTRNETLVRNALGIAYKRKGDSQAASAEFRRAIQLSPQFLDGHLNLGTLLLLGGDAAAAEREFRSCLKIDPNFAEAHYNLGLVLATRQRWAAAAVSLRRAIRLRPKHVWAHWNLGRVLRDSGQNKAALEQYRRACHLDRSLTEAHLEYGKLLAAQGKSDKAVVVWSKAFKRNPIHPRLNEHLASTLELLGHHEKAAQQHRKFRLLTESSDYQKGVLLLNRGKFHRAIGYFQSVLRFDPNLDEVRRNLAVALFANRDYQAAVAEYKRLLEATPEDTDLRLNLGITLLTASLPEEATIELKKVISLNPGSAQAYYQLGLAYLAQQESARAMEQFHHARKIDPGITLPK